MGERKIFQHPIRVETTECFYPDKLTLEEFCQTMEEAIKPFASNMRHLGGEALEPKYVEEWAEQFLAWNEIEEER